MRKTLLAIFALLVFTSHDMFLKLDNYFLAPNETAEIQLFNGTFDKSENVITRDRMQDVSLVGNGKRTAVEDAQWYEKDSITFMRFTTGDPSTWVAGVSTRARNIAMEAQAFNDYLEHDGVVDMLESRKNEGLLEENAVEEYSKHVKTIFQVGDKNSSDWNTELGYPIEFIPLENPYEVHPGHRLKVKLLQDGKPLANQLVLVGSEGLSEENSNMHVHDGGEPHSHEDEESHSHDAQTEHTHDGSTHSHDTATDKGHTHDTGNALRTNSEGILDLDITEKGIWHLRTISMTTSNKEGLTHESNWATLTFAIGDGHSHTASHVHEGETAHSHDDEGIPSYVFWIGSILLLGVLFLVFKNKK